jgi:hypothetical protein
VGPAAGLDIAVAKEKSPCIARDPSLMQCSGCINKCTVVNEESLWLGDSLSIHGRRLTKRNCRIRPC